MPSRNIIKTYVKGGYYHIYNRGVEKRIIFIDEQDYMVFLSYLKEYLSPPPDPKTLQTIFTLRGSTFKGIRRIPKNYSKEIELLVYCLMPNHFHLLIKQNSELSIKKFIHSLLTRYSMYFNKKYKRIGALFQGIYKAALIKDDSYLLHLSRYIHLNPFEYTPDLVSAYSSYGDYLGFRKTSWVKPEFILKFFDQASKDFMQGTNSYKDFVERYEENSKEVLGKMVLE
jgi:putative transposase